MFRQRFVVLVLGAVTLAATAVHSELTAETVAGEESAKVRELMEKRRDVLAKRVEYLTVQFQNAIVPFNKVLDARDDLFAAELELATSSDEQIEVLRSRVENLKELEELFEGLYAKGQADAPTKLLATAHRLAAEIDLARATSVTSQ
ncbi:hypothetical protein [Rhodopirellula sp. MGV]|uniref:hypothetical protein n=1 Tax=Rhodopirellula sp. MGV TaxID=2023130 RepID=UPI000B96B434|nr:hypothetical protein [Rhodopirellula sp. MGV]OYP33880.1 hypothetical protein CGZ80_16955 [Rhodopirellula sp. MGV]PNY37301.1 hypothetical protein C2E31_08455 [Rhodopirellula baltica]